MEICVAPEFLKGHVKAALLTLFGNRFMPDYHEMAELAPRDVVSRAILDTMGKTGASKVFLDVRHLGGEAFAKRFPSIDRQCRAFDLDPSRDLIPVHPAAHYMIGGVQVDQHGPPARRRRCLAQPSRRTGSG